MEIHAKIKARRKELGIPADSVAEAIGVSRSTYYRYESGDIEKIPFDQIIPLADALKCSPAYLMGWESVEDGEQRYLRQSESMPLKMMQQFCEKMDLQEYDYRKEHIDRYIKDLMDTLPRETVLSLIRAAKGCSDKQIQIAIDMLDNFKKGNQDG